MKKILLAAGAFLLISSPSLSQSLAKFKIAIDRPSNGLVIPASINLDELSFQPDSALALMQVDGSKKTPIPFQIKQEEHRTLYWNIAPTEKKELSYELVNAPKENFPIVRSLKNDSSITIQQNGNNLLRYYHAKVDPPKGQHPYYGRSGFIHPLWTPRG